MNLFVYTNERCMRTNEPNSMTVCILFTPCMTCRPCPWRSWRHCGPFPQCAHYVFYNYINVVGTKQSSNCSLSQDLSAMSMEELEAELARRRAAGGGSK